MASFPIDHDLHLHSTLSACCRDEGMTAEAILDFAVRHDYRALCLANHLWDSAVPGASDWYAPQDIAHASSILPLPQSADCQFLFGCETEFLGGEQLGLAPAHFDLFDMIVIPPNHFHMVDFVRPHTCDTEEKVACLLVERLEDLSRLPLPWHKVGIAHINCPLTFSKGDYYRVFEFLDGERLFDVMRAFAKLGAGIEINAGSFRSDWRAHADAALRCLRIAREAGCRFYLASDAHSVAGLESVPTCLPEIVSLLGLSERDLFPLPERAER